jgi:hypothetical protein
MRQPVPPSVAAWRLPQHQQHCQEDQEGEVKDKGAEALDKQTKEEETEAAPQPGALLGPFLKGRLRE